MCACVNVNVCVYSTCECMCCGCDRAHTNWHAVPDKEAQEFNRFVNMQNNCVGEEE